MASAFSHAFVAAALGSAYARHPMPWRFWVLSITCSILPDADVIGFTLGVPYSNLGRPKRLKKVRFSCPEFGPRHQVLLSTSVPIRFCGAWPPELRYPGQPDAKVSNARGVGP